MRTVIAPPLAETRAGNDAETVLRACVHCGFCNATCPTYQLTGDELDGPRGRIYLIKQALEGGEVSRRTQRHLDRCLGCRACETTCPSGVTYHRLYDIGRAVVEAKVGRPWWEKTFRWGLRKVVAEPRLFGPLVIAGNLFRWAMPAKLARKTPPYRANDRHVPAAHPRRMLMLAGCAQPVTASHFNAVTARVFDRLGIAVTEAREAGCCGALSAHLDAVEEAKDKARRNIDAWWPAIEAGCEAILVNASGCASYMKDYGYFLADDPAYAEKARRVASLLKDPIEVLGAMDLTPVRAPEAPRIVIQEPCSFQHGLKLSGSIDRLLRRLGYDPQPVKDAHLCCGSAGAYSVTQPEMAGRLRENKVANLCASGPSAAYTANIGCWMHLNETSPVPVRHWIEAVDEVLA
jgi:glycolate oxidase iron-sulfur subunit